MSATTCARPIEILLVEDSAADVGLTREAFKKLKVRSRLSVVSDGAEAMAFLRNQVPFDDAPRPDLILLDLNMPCMDGREVLAEIKTDDNLKAIPVIVLTTSDSDRDIVECYNLYANGYVTKPFELKEFFAVVESISEFWLEVAKIPLGAELRV